jgi:sialate O-acetylesterase
MNSKLELRRKSSHSYNGMINPIKEFAIKGVLWYQGEANRLDSEHYPALMKGLIEGWRAKFKNKDMPLYFVEIAPYSYGNSDDVVSARFRDAQLEASLLIPNCGMVSTIDIGAEDFIHPPEKKAVGKRLSLWALAETYGMKGISYRTPYYAQTVLRDSVLVVSFEHAEWGLTSFGKELTDFYLAGDDKVFHPAKAYIKNKQVVVHSTEVKKPVAVRYRYTNYPKGDGFLYNVAGLPVTSFRSDDWGL